MDLAQQRQSRQKNETGVGYSLAFVQLDLLERGHTAEDLPAAVGNLRQTGVVVAQREPRDVLRGRVRRVPAIHTPEAFQALAAADVPEAVVLNTDGRELAKGWKPGQRGQRVVSDMLAAHAEASK